MKRKFSQILTFLWFQNFDFILISDFILEANFLTKRPIFLPIRPENLAKSWQHCVPPGGSPADRWGGGGGQAGAGAALRGRAQSRGTQGTEEGPRSWRPGWVRSFVNFYLFCFDLWFVGNPVLRIRDPVPFWLLDPGWVKIQDPLPGWTSRIIFPMC